MKYFPLHHRHMSLVLLMVVGSCSVGCVGMEYLPLQTCVAPNATAIRVVDVGLSSQLLVYDASGPPYAWRIAIATTLEHQGWTDTPGWRSDMGYVSYARVHSFGCVALWEVADLQGGPNRALISIRRWLEVRWERSCLFRVGNQS